MGFAKMITGKNYTFRWLTGRIREVVAGFLVVAVAAVLLPSTGFAQGAGDLIVSPTRVVFEGRERAAQLSLANKGSASATYRITVVNMRMDENGGLTPVETPDPGQKFAGELFRYSPRQVTLKPGAAQAIRLLLRKPADLAAGEYRSHILFRAVPKEGGRSVEQTGTAKGIQVQLIPVYGITIPVIVRHGQVDVKVKLSNLAIAPPSGNTKTPSLKFKINREGSQSLFGDLTATYTPSGGSALVVGQINRLAVYTPNTGRQAEMVLRVPDGVKLSGGKLQLSYNATPEKGGALLGAAEIAVP